MTDAVLDGDPPIVISLRRSARARRLSLRVSSLDGQVTLTLPRRADRDDAMAFAAERREWIERARAGIEPVTRIADGASIPIGGIPRTVRLGTRSRLEGDVLHLSARAPGAAARAFLKARARDALAAASDRHADALGVRYSRIAITDARSRWGSCSSAGRLMYSLRLAMTPPEVQDYVAAHEVAHLLRMDHSPAFWAVVERICPDWRTRRAWLRANGAALHRVRFD